MELRVELSNGDLRVRSDPDLRQVMLNLLTNATKYTEGGTSNWRRVSKENRSLCRFRTRVGALPKSIWTTSGALLAGRPVATSPWRRHRPGTERGATRRRIAGCPDHRDQQTGPGQPSRFISKNRVKGLRWLRCDIGDDGQEPPSTKRCATHGTGFAPRPHGVLTKTRARPLIKTWWTANEGDGMYRNVTRALVLIGLFACLPTALQHNTSAARKFSMRTLTGG